MFTDILKGCEPAACEKRSRKRGKRTWKIEHRLPGIEHSHPKIEHNHPKIDDYPERMGAFRDKFPSVLNPSSETK